MTDYSMPWYTNLWLVLIFFVIFLLVFHLCLVWKWQLSSVTWKQVDYFWVSLALLGVLASVEQTRRLVAINLTSLAESRAKSSLAWVASSAEFGTSIAICRTFVRSAYSPPEPELKEMQQEFDDQCSWFKKLLPKVKELNLESAQTIQLAKLVEPRPVGGEEYAYSQLNQSIEGFNSAQRELQTIRAQQEYSALQELSLVLGPFLLALAVALRLTKVSAEIDIERRKLSAKA